MSPRTRARAAGDRYLALTATGPGAALAARLGLPRPAVLRRHAPGQALLTGPALVIGAGPAPLLAELTALVAGAGADPAASLDDVPVGTRLGAVVLDATAATRVGDLDELRARLGPAVRRLAASGRVVVLGAVVQPGGGADGAGAAGGARGPGGAAGAVERAAVQQALEGITRSLGKELRAGATANLVRVPADAPAPRAVVAAGSALRFLLSSRSAFVAGQVVTVAPAPDDSAPDDSAPVSAAGAPGDLERPLAGRVAVVTGAARGIGASIAEVLAARGAHVVAVDVPAAGGQLAAVANRLGGTALQLDITAPDAADRLVGHLLVRHGGADVVVHNAGITRDRLLVNLDAAQWGSVLAVNLAAQLTLTRALLDADALRPGGRVVAVSSTSGIAGNRGQTNYAASKAGVIGMVAALAPELAARGATANAVAPGFVETEMTARMPLLTREAGRRLNSLSQGGLPVDVAETVSWLAEPASAGITGQVVRVCGQNLLGA